MIPSKLYHSLFLYIKLSDKIMDSNEGLFKLGDFHDRAVVEVALRIFIKSKRDKSRPFFAVASFPDPHHPFDPPVECAVKYPSNNVIAPVGGPEDLDTRPDHYRDHLIGAWHRKGKKSPKYSCGISIEHRNEIIAHTYAMIDLIDQNVGKILDVLEDEGVMDNTIIVFTSDHGELLGDHGLWFKGPFFYEGLINVPLIIKAPHTGSYVSQNLVRRWIFIQQYAN